MRDAALQTATEAITLAGQAISKAERSLAALTPREYLTISHYAHIHDVGRQTVFKWMRAGLLDWYREGKVIRVKNQPPKGAKIFTYDRAS